MNTGADVLRFKSGSSIPTPATAMSPMETPSDKLFVSVDRYLTELQEGGICTVRRSSRNRCLMHPHSKFHRSWLKGANIPRIIRHCKARQPKRPLSLLHHAEYNEISQAWFQELNPPPNCSKDRGKALDSRHVPWPTKADHWPFLTEHRCGNGSHGWFCLDDSW